MTQVIQTQAALNISCGEAAQMPWIGLDTEFERIRTYYPRLCLVQMATSEMTVCIDPLVSLDFAPLRSLLINPDVVKIFHSARQDLEVIHIALGVDPAPLFDTQIAAQFCGYRSQAAYAELVKTVCGVELPKQHTRNAWCRRPLSAGEVEYALDDARYLGRIYCDFKDQLESFGRGNWVREDCDQITGAAILASGPKRAIQKIQARASSFDPIAQSVAYQLAIWREKTAQERDRPREWILSSIALLAIAAMTPSGMEGLKRIQGLPESVYLRWGSAILAVVKTGKILASKYQPMPLSVRPTVKEKRREGLLWDRLKVLCETAGIPMAAVASRAEIRKLAQGKKDLQLLEGWRRVFAGSDLLDIADGEGIDLS
jgi:ribonuclease D